MEFLDRLLAHVPEQQIAAYNSHLHLHLKEMLTVISKNALENNSQIDIRARKCFVMCYRYYMIEPDCENSIAVQKVEQLRTCKTKCRDQLEKVNKFLDKINFFSKYKNDSGVKECEEQYARKVHGQGLGSVVREEDKLLDVDYNHCRWKVLAKLDRRYKDYWLKQRQNVEAKFCRD